MLKRLSEILTSSSDLLVESMQHDKPEESEDYYKRIKDCLLYTSRCVYETDSYLFVWQSVPEHCLMALVIFVS